MVNYDFHDLINVIDKLRTHPDPDVLRDLTHELNMFFKDSICRSTLYTNNTDKQFFGLCVMPVIKDNDIYNILLSDNMNPNDTYRIKEYYVEIDSKLFNPVLNLSNKEILSLILHDVAALVNSSSAVDIAKGEVDLYLDKTNSAIRRSNSVNYAALLNFGFKDLIWKTTSAIFKDNDKLICDDFLISYGFGLDLELAVDKLYKHGSLSTMANGKRDVSIIIAWCLAVYNDILSNRITTVRGLRKSLDYTAIRLIKREIERVITALNRIDDSSLLESSVGDFIKGVKKNIGANLRYNALKDYESDLYEYQIRMKNADEQRDALLLLHSINTKINLIDLILQDPELQEKHREKFVLLLSKYEKLREELGRKNILHRDYNRIYINYSV